MKKEKPEQKIEESTKVAHAEYSKPKQRTDEKIVRIVSKDIEGGTAIYSGLTQIKGVSWTLSNAACVLLGIDKKKKIGDLTEQEIKDISQFLKNPNVPNHMKNRRNDLETGEDLHLIGVDLELKKEFDIKRLKKIKAYRGLRHMFNLPLRGQRTKGNFRRNRKKGSGIKKKEEKK